MKRFLCFILFLSLSFTMFAVDYGLRRFPWNTTYKEILTYFMNNGWSMSIDKDNGFLSFTPKDDYFFQNKLLKIHDVFFSFDKEGNIQSQNFTLDGDYSLSIAYMALLTAAINDSAIFYDQDYKQQDDIDNLYYYAHLTDCDLTCVLAGKDDYYMLVLSYVLLE